MNTMRGPSPAIYVSNGADQVARKAAAACQGSLIRASESALCSRLSRLTSPSRRRSCASTGPLLAPRRPPCAPVPVTQRGDHLRLGVPAPRHAAPPPFRNLKSYSALCGFTGARQKQNAARHHLTEHYSEFSMSQGKFESTFFVRGSTILATLW